MIHRHIKNDNNSIKGTPAPALHGRRKASKVKVNDVRGVPLTLLTLAARRERGKCFPPLFAPACFRVRCQALPAGRAPAAYAA